MSDTISFMKREMKIKLQPHLSKPRSPFCRSPTFVRRAKIARISMTTSYEERKRQLAGSAAVCSCGGPGVQASPCFTLFLKMS